MILSHDAVKSSCSSSLSATFSLCVSVSPYASPETQRLHASGCAAERCWMKLACPALNAGL